MSYPVAYLPFTFAQNLKTTKMINTKLLLLEYAAKNSGANQERLAAIKSIKETISQIDFTAELVPIDNPERLLKLLLSLKGEQLNPYEISVIYDISNN
jgi:hypothetical protein